MSNYSIPWKGAPTAIQRQKSIVPTTLISSRTFLIRNTRVMLDADLATLYHVSTAHLNRAVARNLQRFPADFMFRLTPPEAASLLCQTGVANIRRGGRRTPPYAFTEQGVAMLSSALRSSRQHRDHASLCALAPCTRHPRRTTQDNRANGAALRFEVRSRAHREQADPGISDQVQTTNRFSCVATRSENGKPMQSARELMHRCARNALESASPTNYGHL